MSIIDDKSEFSSLFESIIAISSQLDSLGLEKSAAQVLEVMSALLKEVENNKSGDKDEK